MIPWRLFPRWSGGWTSPVWPSISSWWQLQPWLWNEVSLWAKEGWVMFDVSICNRGVVRQNAFFKTLQAHPALSFRTLQCADDRRRPAASRLGAALCPLLHHGASALLPPLLPCNAVQQHADRCCCFSPLELQRPSLFWNEVENNHKGSMLNESRFHKSPTSSLPEGGLA